MVLARVDQELAVALPQAARYGGRLDELGPVSDDGGDSHVTANVASARFRGSGAQTGPSERITPDPVVRVIGPSVIYG